MKLNKYDILRTAWIVGHIDSYGAVHSQLLPMDDPKQDLTHIDLFGPQATKRWRWDYDHGISTSVYDDKLDVQDRDIVRQHLIRDYDLPYDDDGRFDYQKFKLKRSMI